MRREKRRSPAPSPLPAQQSGEQMAQQRESGSSGLQLLQHGRANAVRLMPRPIANAQHAISSLIRGFLFIVLSIDEGQPGASFPGRLERRRRTPSSAIRRDSVRGSCCLCDAARPAIAGVRERERRRWDSGLRTERCARLAPSRKRSRHGRGDGRGATAGGPTGRRRKQADDDELVHPFRTSLYRWRRFSVRGGKRTLVAGCGRKRVSYHTSGVRRLSAKPIACSTLRQRAPSRWRSRIAMRSLYQRPRVFGPRHRQRDMPADFNSHPHKRKPPAHQMRRRSVSLRSTRRARLPHSHSIVAGGLPLMS